jgi:hypothetical protein
VLSVVVVADDPANCVAARGDRRDTAVSAVAENNAAIEQFGQGVARHDDVVAVTGPALADYQHAAPVRADDDLRIDAAAIVLADGSDRLVVHWDQGAVDDPRMGAGVRAGSQSAGQHWHQLVDDAIH